MTVAAPSDTDGAALHHAHPHATNTHVHAVVPAGATRASHAPWYGGGVHNARHLVAAGVARGAAVPATVAVDATAALAAYGDRAGWGRSVVSHALVVLLLEELLTLEVEEVRLLLRG